MVHPRGVEPPTHALGGRCSILLSYGCTLCTHIFYTIFIEKSMDTEEPSPCVAVRKQNSKCMLKNLLYF